jgi:hypothetical protein
MPCSVLLLTVRDRWNYTTKIRRNLVRVHTVSFLGPLHTTWTPQTCSTSRHYHGSITADLASHWKPVKSSGQSSHSGLRLIIVEASRAGKPLCRRPSTLPTLASAAARSSTTSALHETTRTQQPSTIYTVVMIHPWKPAASVPSSTWIRTQLILAHPRRAYILDSDGDPRWHH